MTLKLVNSWPRAIERAMEACGIVSPSINSMGNMIWKNSSATRFVSLKRRLTPSNASHASQILFGFWLQQNDCPELVASLQAAVEPNDRAVALVVAALKAWLINGVKSDELKTLIQPSLMSTAVRDSPVEPDSQIASVPPS